MPDRIHFHLILLSSKPQTPVSKRPIIFSKVMAIAQTIPASFYFPLLSSVAKSKEGMDQMLSFPQYCFVNHLKSTTPYPLIRCPIFHHYHPLWADNPIFIHDNNIWKK